ncbi:MAG: S41 family peptidase [Ferruginibacter sp.]
MSELTHKKKFQVWMPLLFSITLILGMLLGYKLRDGIPGRNFFSIERSNPVDEVLSLVKNKYVDDVKLQDISDTAITAMLKKLDPHSVFIAADELEAANEELAGGFFGIGVEFDILDDTINVLNVMPDGPSYRAGLKTGDKLIQVNDSVVAGKKMVVKRIKKILRGDNGTNVVLTVLRKTEIKKIPVVRGMIPMKSIDAGYMISNDIGYIRINKFTQVAYREFMQALEELQKKGLKKLILDLRDNGGGVLDEATSIADEFLDGDKLITYTEGKHFPKKEYRCKRPGLFEKGDLILLADDGSASASEVLLGALQDWDRATIVGRRSFGKGLVQEQYDLSDGSALRLTIARYYTPVGRSIQRPYTNGEKAYYNEITNRFHDGEVMSADSIRNDTSKLYETIVKKRKVYGNGGITPDIYIPLDTNEYDKLTAKLYLKSAFSNFAYKFQLQNQDFLNTFKSPEDFSHRFVFTEDYWKRFVESAAKDSVKIENVSAVQKENLVRWTKASIARQLWRNQGFYEVINTDDRAVKRAVELLSKQ